MLKNGSEPAPPVHSKRSDCRVCGGKQLTRFLELGPQPLANAFLDTEAVKSGKEEKFPLDLYVCRACWHVQLLDVVSKETLFSHYLYFSTVSRTIPTHFAELAKEVATRHAQRGDLVVEIGSNDGVLLSAFEGSGLRVLGIEPAGNVAEAARRRGVMTLHRFFTPETAADVARDLGHARVILANNVVGHIDDLEGLTRSVRKLLAPDGVWIFEVPYLVDLLEKNEFDTVYHEHLSYFALHPVKAMLERGGLALVDVKRQSVHGGTIRVYARPGAGAGAGAGAPAPSATVTQLLALERDLKLDSMAPYEAFAKRVHELKTRLRAMLDDLKRDGKRIAGYGAPAKGNTLLNYVGIGTSDLEYIQDTTPVKQGLYTPGTHVPVVPPAHFQTHAPDVALLLAWNYEPEIVAKEDAFRKRGGRFLVPIPMPRLA
jgi:predicted TPR repeat methyltransferase